EMLSGRRAFRGETEVDTMTAVLREDPPAANLEEAAIPLAYQDVVRHCLEKEPADRFQSAKDLGFALQTLSGSGKGKFAIRAHSKRSRTVPWALAALLALATVVLAILYFQPSTPPASYSRLTFEAGTIYSARFTSDGAIIYGAAWSGKPLQ